jgi:hypothetical protein
MNGNKNDIKQYGVEDFERYYSGKMTEPEMHAIEKAALDDPFLADALEGYAFTSTATADFDELKKRLLPKKDNKLTWYKNRPVTNLLKIAAILILVATAGLFLYKNKTEEKPAATTDELVTDKKNAAIKIDSPSAGTLTTKVEQDLLAVQPSQTKQKITLTTSENKSPQSNGLTQSAAYAELPKQATQLTTTDSGKTEQTKLFYTPSTTTNGNIDNTLAGKVSGAIVTTDHYKSFKTIRGRVTDVKGNPVSFASVIDKKNNQAVSADKEGTFILPAKDSETLVAVNAIGYETVTRRLRYDTAMNYLVLPNNNAGLQEVVVTSGYQTKKRSASQSTISTMTGSRRVTITNALPVNGWQSFNNYVEDSLKTLEQLGPLSTSAEVLVTFKVNNNGTPVKINVKSSLCPACDAEARRIIENGPTWQLNNKRKKANAVIRF